MEERLEEQEKVIFEAMTKAISKYLLENLKYTHYMGKIVIENDNDCQLNIKIYSQTSDCMGIKEEPDFEDCVDLDY